MIVKISLISDMGWFWNEIDRTIFNPLQKEIDDTISPLSDIRYLTYCKSYHNFSFLEWAHSFICTPGIDFLK